MAGFGFNYKPVHLRIEKITAVGEYIYEVTSHNPWGQTSVAVFIGNAVNPVGTGTATLRLETNDHPKDSYTLNADQEANEWINSSNGDITASGKYVLQQPCQRLKVKVTALNAGHYIRIIITA